MGCSKHAQLDTKWSAPIKFSETKEGLAASFDIYKWNNTVLALQRGAPYGSDDEFKCSVLGHDGVTWQNTKLTGFHDFYQAIIDPVTNRFVFVSFANSKIDAKFILRTVSLDETDLQISDITRKELTSTPSLSPGEYVDGPVSGTASSRGSEYFVPYTIRTMAHLANGAESSGAAYPIGLFYSPDGGLSWQQHEVLRRRTWDAAIGAMQHDLYFLGRGPWNRDEIWFSKQDIDRFSSASERLTKTCADGDFLIANTSDTIHLCWLDSRHEQIPSQLSMFLFGEEGRRNYEIFYRHVTDSNDSFGKEILISKGLLFAYSPAIFAEGKKVVIAWAGARKPAERYYDDYCPNDIYYAVSRDNGETWSDPVRVTDNIPQGMTAGCPQVALLNNAIHLFYIEGKYHKNPSVSGLSLIKQPPWDIIYQQRPFPD